MARAWAAFCLSAVALMAVSGTALSERLQGADGSSALVDRRQVVTELIPTKDTMWPSFVFADRALAAPRGSGGADDARAALDRLDLGRGCNATSAVLREQGDVVHAAECAKAEEQVDFVWAADFINGLLLPESWRARLPLYMQGWLRNFLAGTALYYVTGGLWALYIYRLKADKYFPGGQGMPSRRDVLLQIWVSQRSLVLYTLMPTLSDFLIEHGWTMTFFEFSAWPLWAYVFFHVLYFVAVEWGIYWVHRLLHDWKPGYKWLHATHHKYNKENTLSPFAGLAFHPIDGMLQASPYVVGLFMVPVHYWAHLGMLFFTAVWTTNIHDTLDGRTEPIMGAAYHTIHHTTYRHNYGQIFTFWDWYYGTLRVPKRPEDEKKTE